jgi:hypothetical protein
MLHWFAKRLKEVHEKDAKGEKGLGAGLLLWQAALPR